jgi:hypothetical protein
MGKATWSNKPQLNLRKNKQSHLVLIDLDGRFSAKTAVTAVKDLEDANITFDGTPLKRVQANRLEIRLKSTSKYSKKDDITPTSGTLSITLTDTSTGTPIPVDPVPVDYVDDTDACA